MVVIRCTQKLLRRLNPIAAVQQPSTTRLGDWSANLIGVRHRRFVLLVSERTRLPIIVYARDVKRLRKHLVDALLPVLVNLGVSAGSIERELSEMGEGVITSTNSRSVVGSVNDFAKAMKWRMYEEPDVDLVELALWLSETPITALGGESPIRMTRDQLQ